jgi:hypothetical protein
MSILVSARDIPEAQDSRREDKQSSMEAVLGRREFTPAFSMGESARFEVFDYDG